MKVFAEVFAGWIPVGVGEVCVCGDWGRREVGLQSRNITPYLKEFTSGLLWGINYGFVLLFF